MRDVKYTLSILVLLVLVFVVTVPSALGDDDDDGGPTLFDHVGTFDVTTNSDSEVAEIVAASSDGRTLIYTDSDAELIGFVDISDPSNPKPDGVVKVGGEPTSVAVKGRYALVGVNRSITETVTCENDDIEYITDWAGTLAVIDVHGRHIVQTIDLDGQPDSVAVSPNGRYAAIVLENERNEDVGDGLIPQGQVTNKSDPCHLKAVGDAKPGTLIIVNTTRNPGNWTTRSVDLRIPGMFAEEDPEPEYVDINHRNEAVVTLQENNHIAVVDLRTGMIKKEFSAGSVDLTDVDATEEELGPQEKGLINFVETLEGQRREPDAATWISSDLFAIANEGDYEDAEGKEGGSRGFTIFDRKGSVIFESGEDFEYASASAGHYNEGRSANKGGEPEAVEFGRFGDHERLFVGAERANIVGVYDLANPADPELLQLLPTGIGPEGLLAIPRRDLFVVANENAEDGVPSMITLYKAGDSNYPQLVSDDDIGGTPIPWVAMSGLAGDPSDADTIYGVSDSFLAKGFIYTIDVSGDSGLIIDRIEVTLPSGTDFFPDLEGIAVAPEGGFWLASEGRNGARPTRLSRPIKTAL